MLQRIAEWSEDRLPASVICDLADRWLASELCVWLDPTHRSPTVRPAVRARPRSCTRHRRCWRSNAGFSIAFPPDSRPDTAVVPDGIVELIVNGNSTLGADQADVVRAITRSGDQTQCVVGPAGTGKTFTLEVAAGVWQTPVIR